MATKPTITDGEWATDSTFSSGPASGTSTKVNPTSTKAQGWRPGDALGFVAAWANWTLNQFYLWAVYLNDLHNSADFLNKSYTWLTGTHRFTGNVRFVSPKIESGDLLYSDSAGVATPVSRNKDLVFQFVPANGTAGPSIATAGNAYAAAGAVDGVLYIELPTGATLTGVSVGCTPAGSGAVGFTAQKEAINTSSGAITLTTLGSTQTSSGTAYQQLTTSFSEAIANNGNRYRIYLSLGAINHTVSYVAISFSDPGFQGNG